MQVSSRPSIKFPYWGSFKCHGSCVPPDRPSYVRYKNGQKEDTYCSYSDSFLSATYSNFIWWCLLVNVLYQDTIHLSVSDLTSPFCISNMHFSFRSAGALPALCYCCELLYQCCLKTFCEETIEGLDHH